MNKSLMLLFVLSGVLMLDSVVLVLANPNKPKETPSNSGSETFSNSATPTIQSPPPHSQGKPKQKGKGKNDNDGGQFLQQTGTIDLVVTSFTITAVGGGAGDSALPNTSATLEVTIKNIGTDTAENFRLDVWSHLPNAPTLNMVGDFATVVSSLAGGQSLTFVNQFVIPGGTGTYVARAVVDSTDAVFENLAANSELNNNTTVGTYTAMLMGSQLPSNKIFAIGHGGTFQLHGKSSPYGEPWVPGKPTETVTSGLTITSRSTTTQGDVFYTVAVAANQIGVGTITSECGNTLTSNVITSGMLSLTPSHQVILSGKAGTFTANSDPVGQWADGWPQSSLTTTPNGQATLSNPVTIGGEKRIAVNAVANANGVGTLTVFHGTSTKTATMTFVDTATVDWVGLDSNFEPMANPGTHGGGHRIFPDRNTPNDTLHNRVAVGVTLTQALPAGASLTLWWRVFDVDDPSQDFGGPGTGGGTNTADVNDTAVGVFNGNDNRPAPGGMSATSGSITILGGSLSSVSPAFSITSRQPGNNWKFVVGASLLEVNLMVLNTATMNGRTEVLSFRQTATGPAVPANRQSQLLSVWRKLHVEVDSMAAVPNSGSQVNTISGNITDIGNGGASLTVNVSLRDGSPDLNTPPAPPPPGPGNGRFENGLLFVGQTATTTYLTASNGSNFLMPAAATPFTLPFSLVNSSGGSLVSGLVLRMEQIASATQFVINESLTPSAYVGGTFTILGVSSPVAANGVVTIITSEMVIPFTVHDDDNDFLLPLNVAPGNNGTLLSVLTETMREAFIEVLDDEGGEPLAATKTTPHFS